MHSARHFVVPRGKGRWRSTDEGPSRASIHGLSCHASPLAWVVARGSGGMAWVACEVALAPHGVFGGRGHVGPYRGEAGYMTNVAQQSGMCQARRGK